ncbi:MAG: MerR family DNA-binding transcriptional regulator [Planctomycetaceae bacterium]|nr:MerR family DNA-binding transcriptional regulator [Planctomycetales bacterium]MCB9927174.1 MerR family DNA-binding transcriptional regulator [Planctomycetaceae bacterium]
MATDDCTRFVSIGVLSEKAGLSCQTLREYERRGIVECVRSIGGQQPSPPSVSWLVRQPYSRRAELQPPIRWP